MSSRLRQWAERVQAEEKANREAARARRDAAKAASGSHTGQAQQPVQGVRVAFRRPLWRILASSAGITLAVCAVIGTVVWATDGGRTDALIMCQRYITGGTGKTLDFAEPGTATIDKNGSTYTVQSSLTNPATAGRYDYTCIISNAGGVWTVDGFHAS